MSTMLLGQRQKTRKGVQVPFLEKLLDGNKAKLAQAESQFDGTEGKQQERLQVLEKINKAKTNIEEITKAIEYSKNTEYFRHPNIPQSIPDEHVWNDAWYDEKRKGWITLNQYFFEATNAMDREIQRKYNQENITLPGIIIEEEKIQFRMGLPSILQIDDKNRPTWFALSTLYDVMLTKEIVKGMIYPEGENNAYIYTTGSDAYISILGRYLTEAEYEFAKEFHPFMSKKPLEVIRAMGGRPHDEKLYKKQLKQMEKQTKEWEKQQVKKN
ncbi:MAG: hypothetical protein OER82_01605 [Nitrosopumilus sp.]|nr:hypothetical protein [Nitrosopumilus sp.]